MAEQKSIYELISDNIINGKLDENFVLPDDSEGPVKFAAGAMDGMCVYHMRPYEMTTEDYNILEKSVAAVSTEILNKRTNSGLNSVNLQEPYRW